MATRKGIRRRGRSWTCRLAAVAGLVAVSGGGLQAASDDLRLVEAVKAQRWEAVRSLLAHGLDVDATQGDGATALHWAVYWDDQQTAELLIRAGADVDAANDYEVTPLWLACANASGEMVERLLAAGADAKATLTSGETALMACARTGSVDAVEALLNRGAEVDAREAAESQTALMWATAQRHPAVVRLLLDHGADPNARSRVRREVISRRLQADLRYGERSRSLGSDAEETDIGGFTPLLFAARVGDLESARLLLGRGGQRQRHGAGRRQRAGGGDAQRPRGARAVPAGRGRQPECGDRRLHGIARGRAAGRPEGRRSAPRSRRQSERPDHAGHTGRAQRAGVVSRRAPARRHPLCAGGEVHRSRDHARPARCRRRRRASAEERLDTGVAGGGRGLAVRDVGPPGPRLDQTARGAARALRRAPHAGGASRSRSRRAATSTPSTRTATPRCTMSSTRDSRASWRS